MIAILAEKPSVGQEIARIVGAKEKRAGYIFGNGYMVTWALGHLVQLALPGAYGNTELKNAAGHISPNSGRQLPIIPDPFQLIVRQTRKERKYVNDPSAVRQLGVIDKVLAQCSSIIVATDSAREGELVFRYIYSHTGCTLPFKRLWISSLTEEAITKGLENLKEGTHYDNLFHAAECRAKADWLTGMNASMALGAVAGTLNHSLGRVQTPTLAMICKRYLENRNFQPLDYWKIVATLTKDDIFHGFQLSEDIRKESRADEVLEAVRDCAEATITKVEKRSVQEPAPLLYDLTALQKDCNTFYDMTAAQTLEVAQSLYERGLISYPRTGSRYITPDIAPQIPSLLRMILRMERFAHFENSIDVLRTHNRCVNADKVTDHHALILTGYFAKELTEDEDQVYNLIAGRMLEAFAPKCEKAVTIAEADIKGFVFRSRMVEITAKGWCGVYDRSESQEDDDTQSTSIDMAEGEKVAIGGFSTSKGKTQPRPLFTEATLLGAMELCGSDIDDEKARLAMRDCGIGTPATRAAIITTLFEREYIERSGKSLIPTEKGLYVYRAVKDMRIADPELTGNWEEMLSMIENGKIQPETFMNSITIYTRQVTNEILLLKIPKEQANLPLCPKCKKGGIVIRHRVCKCNDPQCGLILFRKFLNKELSDENISELLINGKTNLIKGFEGKRNNTFDAYLTFDPNFNVIFLFPDKKGKKKQIAAQSKPVAKRRSKPKSVSTPEPKSGGEEEPTEK